MNEEEKQAIEKLKSIVKVNNDFLKGVENQTINQEEIKSIEIALKLIEKQQKEIEELKHDNSILCEIAYTGKRIQLPYTMVYTGTDNFISKDRIKEKIKEVENREENYTFDKLTSEDIRRTIIANLEELLGE